MLKCSPTVLAYQAAYRAANKELCQARSKAWAERNRERRKKVQATYHAANREKRNARIAELQKAHPAKAARKSAEWRAANPERSRAIVRKYKTATPGFEAKRRAAKLQATPSWVDTAQLECFYLMAARVSRCLGIPHQVDHMAPLKSKRVCGLHSPGNLSVIPATINLKKGNRSWPQMWNAK